MQIKLKKHHERYDKYKQTGIPWIGEVPYHWKIQKLKYFAHIIAGQSPEGETVNNKINNGLPFLQGKAEFGTKNPIPINYCSAPKKVAKKNSILISVRAPVGELNIADKLYCIGRGLASVESDNTKYMFYLLTSVKKHLISLSTGSTFEAITTNDLNQTFFPTPNRLEQNTISNYLDNKILLIEQLIKAKQRQIELLKEKRSALINQAVTRGLDKNTELKDSGIEWLGKIPKGWNILQIKRITNFVSRGNSPDYSEEETNYLVLNQACIYWEGLKMDNVKYHVASNYSEKKGLLKKNDLVMNSTGTGTLGRIAIFEDGKNIIADGHITIIRCNKNIDPHFLLSLFSTNLYQGFIYSYCVSGSTNQIELSRSRLVETPVILPTLELQKRIYDFIYSKTQHINHSITKIEQSISLLEEYKTSLISNAVTGKIKIIN